MHPQPSYPLPETLAASSPSRVRRTVECQAAAPGYHPNRLRRHADYQLVYKASRKRTSSSMAWFAAPQSPPSGASNGIDPGRQPTRVGLTVGKPLGKAHERNRIKRRLRSVVAKHHCELPPGVDLVLHPRRSVMTMEFSKLEAEISQIFKQVSTLSTRRAPSPGQPQPQR